MQDLVDSAERLLADICIPQAVRAIETGESSQNLWRQLDESGFMDALIPEANGGAGLTLHEVFPLLLLCGKYAVPMPFASTMLLRGLWATQNQSIPSGAITMAPAVDHSNGIVCRNVPYGNVADWIAINWNGRVALLPSANALREPIGVHGSLSANLRWPDTTGAMVIDASIDPLILGACVYAAQLAGAMEQILAITLRYANERVQFGRPIAKFQAIQHHLSVMAEHVYAARMAAEIGCRSASPLPDPALAGVAKARTSEAATLVASLGHAVHGAIGFTAEYELQLHTRRLYEWRLAYGSELFWNERVGAELLAGTQSTLEFIRGRLFPSG